MAVGSSACSARSCTSGCWPRCPPGVLQFNRAVDRFEQDETGVRLHLRDGEVIEADVLVGADGIDSLVRRTLWGDARSASTTCTSSAGSPSTSRRPRRTRAVPPAPQPDRAGQLDVIRSKGRDGYQWWVLGAHAAREAFDGDLHGTAAAMAAGFPAPLPELIAATDPANVQRWVLRDRKPLKQWSKGRATIVGDAAHPTCPYAAYGAGMATEDGYFLGAPLRRGRPVRLRCRTAGLAGLRDAAQAAHRPPGPAGVVLGKLFHHAPPPLQAVRDVVLDHTPFLQKVVGDSAPREILKQLAEIDAAEERFAVARKPEENS